ncbi:MAG: carbon monoxide dehydrogenase subunit G [Proteobacteria bacterium]|nr:carbon monoxide dehydrogenase subunit G [Pseudomonadota bacterium]MDA1059490.1 carbon monoxide dehydrogenase subunit G [Pseudomonadota bacterium]
MDMKGEYRIPATKQAVWEALNDPETLKTCIPGCETIEKTSDTEMTATVKAKVGPVSARFKGKVTLSDLNPPNSYRISGEGQGGPAGFGKGGATVSLEEDGTDTILRYEANAQVGGKLAQIGARLVDGAAKKIADEFFSNFAAHVGGAAARSDTSEQPAADGAGIKINHEEVKPSKTISTATWIVGLVAVVAVVLLLFSVL